MNSVSSVCGLSYICKASTFVFDTFHKLIPVFSDYFFTLFPIACYLQELANFLFLLLNCRK